MSKSQNTVLIPIKVVPLCRKYHDIKIIIFEIQCIEYGHTNNNTTR
jgi:hypothetical protein